MTKAKSGKKRWLDLLLYLAVGSFVVLLIIVYASTTPTDSEFPVQLIMAVCMTGMVFGYVIKFSHNHWGNVKFWGILCTIFALHAVVYFLLLKNYQQIPILFLGMLALPEILVIGLLIDKLLPSHED